MMQFPKNLLIENNILSFLTQLKHDLFLGQTKKRSLIKKKLFDFMIITNQLITSQQLIFGLRCSN